MSSPKRSKSQRRGEATTAAGRRTQSGAARPIHEPAREDVRLLLRFLYHELHGFAQGFATMTMLLERDLQVLLPEPRQLPDSRQHVRAHVDEILHAMGETADATLTLMQKLRILARDEKLPLEQRRQIPLRELCERLQERVRLYAEEKLDLPATIALALPDDLRVLADPQLLELALHEILRNAVQECAAVTLDDSTIGIVIGAEQRETSTIIHVEDDATRFSAELLEQLHDPSIAAIDLFFALRSLVFPLLVQIAALHDADIQFGNHADRPGSWVRLSFPAPGS